MDVGGGSSLQGNIGGSAGLGCHCGVGFNFGLIVSPLLFKVVLVGLSFEAGTLIWALLVWAWESLLS